VLRAGQVERRQLQDLGHIATLAKLITPRLDDLPLAEGAGSLRQTGGRRQPLGDLSAPSDIE
jgi:hypothetical protein